MPSRHEPVVGRADEHVHRDFAARPVGVHVVAEHFAGLDVVVEDRRAAGHRADAVGVQHVRSVPGSSSGPRAAPPGRRTGSRAARGAAPGSSSMYDAGEQRLEAADVAHRRAAGAPPRSAPCWSGCGTPRAACRRSTLDALHVAGQRDAAHRAEVDRLVPILVWPATSPSAVEKLISMVGPRSAIARQPRIGGDGGGYQRDQPDEMERPARMHLRDRHGRRRGRRRRGRRGGGRRRGGRRRVAHAGLPFRRRPTSAADRSCAAASMVRITTAQNAIAPEPGRIVAIVPMRHQRGEDRDHEHVDHRPAADRIDDAVQQRALAQPAVRAAPAR